QSSTRSTCSGLSQIDFTSSRWKVLTVADSLGSRMMGATGGLGSVLKTGAGGNSFSSWTMIMPSVRERTRAGERPRLVATTEKPLMTPGVGLVEMRIQG